MPSPLAAAREVIALSDARPYQDMSVRDALRDQQWYLHRCADFVEDHLPALLARLEAAEAVANGARLFEIRIGIAAIRTCGCCGARMSIGHDEGCPLARYDALLREQEGES